MGEDFSISVGAKLDESSFQTMQEKIKSLEKEPIKITIGKDIETQIASLRKTLESINININGGKGLDVGDLINYNSNALRSQAKKVGQEYGTIVGESVQEAINNVTTKGVGKSRYRDIGVFDSDSAVKITRQLSENLESEMTKLVNAWTDRQGKLVKFQATERTRWDSDIDKNVTELDKVLVTYKNNLDEVIQKTISWNKVGEESSGKNKKKIYGWVETSAQYSKSLEEATAKSETFADSQAKIAARLKNTLESIKSSVSDKNTSKPITEQGHLDDLTARYCQIETAIENVRTADKSTATQMKINAESLINTLQNTVKEYRNAENVSTNLKGIDVTSAKSIAENNLEKFKSDAKDVSTQMKKH
ncbi:MAG: hypothetical protein LUC97_02095 [Clostridiales bacterium]|nr:hypothetical protein [Clostridiales bacterium]